MSLYDQYWLKISFGLLVVSLPFLIAAFRKKISWRFFFSWTLGSVFATLTVFFIKTSMEKHMDEKTRLITSIVIGSVFMSVGGYLRTIKSQNLRSIGLMFLGFGIIWIALSL